MAKIDLTEYLEKLKEPEDRETVANREYQQQLFLEYVVRGEGAWVEMTSVHIPYLKNMSRPLCGGRGLKYCPVDVSARKKESPPVRGAWVEIAFGYSRPVLSWRSPPVRGAWVEIRSRCAELPKWSQVAPCAGGVG